MRRTLTIFAVTALGMLSACTSANNSKPPVNADVAAQHAELKIELIPQLVPPPSAPKLAAAEPATVDSVVQFGFDSAVPLDAGKLLDQVAGRLAKHPGWAVEIDGYASSENHPWAEQHNNELSTHRAEAVRQLLLKKGVPSDRLTVKGFGTADPVASNDTEDDRSKNRRVVFTVTVTLKPAKPQ